MDDFFNSKRFIIIMLLLNMFTLALWTTDLINDFQTGAEGGQIAFHGFFMGLSFWLVKDYSYKLSEVLDDKSFLGFLLGIKKPNPFDKEKENEKPISDNPKKENTDNITEDNTDIDDKDTQ